MEDEKDILDAGSPVDPIAADPAVDDTSFSASGDGGGLNHERGRVMAFLGRSVSEGSWLSWGLILLLATAVFAIYQIFRVILVFVD